MTTVDQFDVIVYIEWVCRISKHSFSRQMFLQLRLTDALDAEEPFVRITTVYVELRHRVGVVDYKYKKMP